MDAARFARIEALFDAAVALPAGQREAFLIEQETDVALVGEVRRLLARDDGAAFPHAALTAVVSLRPQPGAQIGEYRVLRELGEGGMGTVLLAERPLGESRQRVALKLIRGIPTPSSRERLARERALLAELNHPGIARLLDAGATADAEPWLAMEHVDGEPLLVYCELHALPLRARLTLFVQICRAVQHAHQRLIVHRDIKPANILVREDGTPVLVDFGIGKLIEPGTDDATATHAYTPAYAAPEQRAGGRVTTAADIWGLGAVLFELISGRAMTEVRDGDRVPRASTVAGSAARDLRGDLDAIVATALREEPEARYASAQALADDIERYLGGQPVHAQPDRLGYRLRKFATRHRFAVAVAAVSLALIAGLVWRLVIERNDALQQAQRAQTTRDFLVSLFRFADPNVHQGAPASVREMLDEGSRRVDSDLAAQPWLRAELSEALGLIYRDIGDDASALTRLRTAAELTPPGEDALVRARRIGFAARAGLKQARLENGKAALVGLDEALALLGERHDAPALLLRLQLMSSRSLALAIVDRLDDAVRELGKAMDLLPQLGEGADAQRGNLLYDLTKLQTMRGDASAADDDANQAEAAYARAYGRDHPETIKAMDLHASLLAGQAQTRLAEDKYRQILAAQAKAYPAGNPHIAHAQIALADLLLTDRQLDEALALFEAHRAGCIEPDTTGFAPGVPCHRVLRGVGLVRVLRGDRGGLDELEEALRRCKPADAYVCTSTMLNVGIGRCVSGDKAGGVALLQAVELRQRGGFMQSKLDTRRTAQLRAACGVPDAAAPSADRTDPPLRG